MVSKEHSEVLSTMEATLLPPAGKAADPYACIGTKNAKHVQNCLELYMNDRGIDYLPEGVFERFIDLKYLWLMRNNLAKLENLDENFRLHCLYLSKNRLTTFVDSSLAKLKNLEELHASDNQLTDLHEHIEVLKKLRRLKRLDLKGNPLAHETKYRLHVIKHMPWLEELDLVTVTDAERAKFDAKQAAMARAMAAPKIPVVNSRAHQNMRMDVDEEDDAGGRDEQLVVDEATLARAKDAARRNAEAEAWGLNAVGKADIFLKTKKGGVAKKGKRASGGAPTPKQLAAQTFHVDAKSRKKMKRQLKQVRGARLKVPA